MTRSKRIGILTGGGDVPGLNAVIKSVVYRATEVGYDVLGIRRGWEGLTHVRPEPRRSTRTTSGRSTGPTPGRSTGPAARSCTPRGRTRARCASAGCRRGWTRPTRAALRDRRRHLRPDAARPRPPRGARDRRAGHDRRRRHAVVLAGPGRTPACRWSRSPRRWTTTSRAPSTASASRRRSPGPRRSSTASGRRSGRHERIGVFRIFGRDAGFSALYTAYVTSARCVIPEAPYDLDALAGDPRRRPRARTRATTPSSSPPRARSGRARR